MKADQRALEFSCKGCALIGVIDVPERPLSRGVLVVSGTHQYRIGSHRHCALLARLLVPRGIPVMRFDYRGMGDSEGDPRSFDTIDDDIQAAIREFFLQMPDLKEIVIWGMYDAASAAALYAHTDQNVRGLVLLNPCVSASPQSTRIPLFPHLLARFGELGLWRRATRDNATSAANARAEMHANARDEHLPLGQRVAASLACFTGEALVLLAGTDPIASEFGELTERHQTRCRRITIADTDHNCARRAWRDEVAEITANWIVSW